MILNLNILLIATLLNLSNYMVKSCKADQKASYYVYAEDLDRPELRAWLIAYQVHFITVGKIEAPKRRHTVQQMAGIKQPWKCPPPDV